MDRLKNFNGKRGINGLEKNPQNINRNGKPPSIRTQIKRLLMEDGEIFIPKKRIIKQNEKGIYIKITTWFIK